MTLVDRAPTQHPPRFGQLAAYESYPARSVSLRTDGNQISLQATASLPRGFPDLGINL